MAEALLFVDAQRDYFSRAELHPAAPTLETALETLLEAVRARGWPVFHVRTEVTPDGANAMPHWRAANRLFCVKGTAGAEPPAALQALPGEYEFSKQFFSAFDHPGLLPSLQAADVHRIIVAGLYTHACVRSTAVDAYARGLEVFVAADAVGSYDPRHADLTLNWLHGRAARCLPVRQILALLDGK